MTRMKTWPVQRPNGIPVLIDCWRKGFRAWKPFKNLVKKIHSCECGTSTKRTAVDIDQGEPHGGDINPPFPLLSIDTWK